MVLSMRCTWTALLPRPPSAATSATPFQGPSFSVCRLFNFPRSSAPTPFTCASSCQASTVARSSAPSSRRAISGSPFNFLLLLPSASFSSSSSGLPSLISTPSSFADRPFCSPFGKRSLGSTTVMAVASEGTIEVVPASGVDRPSPEYRRNVGICLVNKDGKVFTARRINMPDAWQMPQGGIDSDEEIVAAAFRELKEETGVTSAAYVAQTDGWYTYDFPDDVMHKLTSWKGKFKGQAQKWVLFKFTGEDSEIDLEADGEEQEFSEWRWAPLDATLVEKAVPFKRQVYAAIVHQFSAILEAQ